MSQARRRSDKKGSSSSSESRGQWVDALHGALAEAKVLESSLSGRERSAGRESAEQALFRCFHNIKAFAQSLGFHGVQTVAHELESRYGSPTFGSGVAGALRKIDSVLAKMHEVELRAAGLREAALERKPAPSAARTKRVSDLFARIESVARGVAADLGRELDWEHEGGDIELEADWESNLEAALLHAVRNGIDHGSQEEAGPLRLRLRAELRDLHLRIECSDSGVGVDPSRVREAARARQPRFDAEMGAMSDEDVLQLLFLPGFSLSRGVSRLSGRGYGLDIVREAVETRLGGSARIESRPGQGTTLVLRIPVSKRG